MKPAEIRGLGDGELREKLQELKDDLFRLRFQAATDPEANPSQVKKLRREIARVKTVQRERAWARDRGAEETTG